MAEEHTDDLRRRRNTGSMVLKALLTILVSAVALHSVRQLLEKRSKEAEPRALEQFSSHPLGEGEMRRYLRDPAWEGIGSIFSILTAVLALGLTVYLGIWTAQQDQAQLFVHPPAWVQSADGTTWRLEVQVANLGPVTASDLTVRARVVSSEPVTLTKLVLLGDSGSTEFSPSPDGGVIRWSLVNSMGGIEPVNVSYRDYDCFTDRLSVGHSMTIQADFETDANFVERLLEIPTPHPSLLKSGLIAKERQSTYRSVQVSNMRAYFIYDVIVGGNKVVTKQSSLWTPPAMR